MGLPLCRNARPALFPALSVLAITLATGTIPNAALADPHRGNNPRFGNPSHAFDTNFSRHVSRHGTPMARYTPRFDNRRHDFYNTRYRPAGSRFRFPADRFSNRFYNDYGGWSVSLSLGSAWYDNRWNGGFGGLYYGNSYGGGLPGRIYAPYRNTTRNTTIVYRQPTVVIVNDSIHSAGHVSERVIRTGTPKPARSLLRDIHGDCWERNVDSRGVETRVQLPDSACNF